MLRTLICTIAVLVSLLSAFPARAAAPVHEVTTEEPRFLQPRENRIYPAAGKLSRRLLVLDTRKLSAEEKLLALSAQGLVNSDDRRPDKVYVVWGDNEQRWLKWLIEHNYIAEKRELAGLGELLDLATTRSAVLFDDTPAHLPNVALAVASCERKLLVRSEELARRYGILIDTDLRHRFRTNIEAYEWTLDKYGDQLSTRALAVYHPSHGNVLRDYLYANRILTFWVSGKIDGKDPGSDAAAERAFFHHVLASRFPVNIPVLGYPWAGDGVGIGENGGVDLLSQCGKFLVPSDHITNLSVWTLFPNDKCTPIQPRLETVHYTPGKHYAALVVSDGDNLCTYNGFFFPNYWQGLAGQKFPVGWTMGPTLRDLMPPVFDYVRENLRPGDSVGCAVSGVGYISLAEYGKAFGAKRPEVIAEFMALTDSYARRAGESWLWMMHYGKAGGTWVKSYCQSLKNISVLMGGYGREAANNPAESIEEIDGKVVFHTLNRSGGTTQTIEELDRLLKPTTSPLFLNVFIFNWTIKPPNLVRINEHLASQNVVIVTPENLGKVYKEYEATEPKKPTR